MTDGIAFQRRYGRLTRRPLCVVAPSPRTQPGQPGGLTKPPKSSNIRPVRLTSGRAPGDGGTEELPLARAKAPERPAKPFRHAVEDEPVEDERAGEPSRVQASSGGLSVAVADTAAFSDRLQEQNDRLASRLESTESELRRYRDFFRLAPDGHLVTDADGLIVEANHASAALLDIDVDGLEGKRMMSFLNDGDSAATVDAQLGQLSRGREVHGWEVYVQPRGKRPFPVTVNVSTAQTSDGRVVGLHWQLHDITDRKRTEDELAFKANHDALTGLPNRSMFQELLDLSLARARRRDLGVAVLYLDLDQFKLVNDSRGHTAGDELLCQVASRLSDLSRETDIVARLGGDEFAILLSDLAKTDRDGESSTAGPMLLTTKWVASRIHDSLRAAFSVVGTETFASASIGLSMFPTDAGDAQALLEHADAAMYRSKRDGPGGTTAFSGPNSNDKMTSFAVQLRAATDERQWVLHYQPIVDLTGGRVIAAEALLRWKNGDGSLTAPSEFIHLAEDMGLIEAIGEWVLEEVARQSRCWSQANFDVDIGFNVSPHQLWEPSFARRLLSTLESQNVEPTRVVMEITESAAMGHPDRRMDVLWELHSQGVRLAIDDFGTGYSSLTRLQRLPIDILKIDRSFVHDLPRDGAANVAAATIQLAHNLGIIPLAEGIETTAQRDYVVAHGCALGQGYLFGRPIPPEEIAHVGVGTK
jgi:diguanylate cyclase (GGDEF)-like protein/PAS domain S-box-containing protein